MKLFRVELYKDVWSFSPHQGPKPDDGFPDEFYAFERSRYRWKYLVWIQDNTQALVAYDWLIERGWELDTDTTDPQRLAFLNLLNATADK